MNLPSSNRSRLILAGVLLGGVLTTSLGTPAQEAEPLDDCMDLPTITILVEDQPVEVPLPNSPPEVCAAVDWCVCLNTGLSSQAAGASAAVRYRQIYALQQPLFGIQIFFVDRGTLDLTGLEESEEGPPWKIGDFVSRFPLPIPGSGGFLLEFSVQVTDSPQFEGETTRAPIEARFQRANPDTLDILGYDPSDSFHSDGLLYTGSIISFGEDQGFELFLVLPEDPPDGSFFAIEPRDLYDHDLNLPIDVTYLDPEISAARYLLPDVGPVTITTILEDLPGLHSIQFEDTFELGAAKEFRRGDSNGDGEVGLDDAISVLGYLFAQGEKPSCPDAADADDTGSLDISDAIALLTWLFLGGPAPPAPGPGECGPDPTPDRLLCPVSSCLF